MGSTLRNNRGFILIMALWTLAFLAVLAVSMAFGTRQKIVLIGRLEDRSRAQLAAEAGVKKAVAVLVDDLENNQFTYSSKAKARRHDNPDEFSNVLLADGSADVVCDSLDDISGVLVERYGLCDEQAKININTADRETLTRLIVEVMAYQDDVARKIADDIVDWRDYGRHEAEGFFSDDYYKSLEYPYAMKEKIFERIDELLLVKGVSKDFYDRMHPYITVSGDGRVNVNTVSKKVLTALGLDPLVADKVLKARRGQDGKEATGDDHIFYRTFDIAAEVAALTQLDEKEGRQIDALNTRGLLSVDSMVYGIKSMVAGEGAQPKRTIEAVFNALSNKYEYWYEK